jgi:hypothetical protein
MADAKITALTELTEPSADDLLAIVDDPGGTPVTKKVTRANVRRHIVEATAKTANYTLTANDEVILADTTGGTFTVTAPTASGNKGKPWFVKKIAGSASVMVVPDGVETIDGASSYELVNINEVVHFTSDGTNLIILGVYTA